VYVCVRMEITFVDENSTLHFPIVPTDAVVLLSIKNWRSAARHREIRDEGYWGGQGQETGQWVVRGEFRPRQTRQLPRAVDLKGRLLSCQSY